MTEMKKLRDEFAKSSLQIAYDLESKFPIGENNELTYKGIAMRAYLLADAMLLERDKK